MGQVEKRRLTTDARNDNGLPALDHLSGNSLPQLESRRSSAVLEPLNGLNVDLAIAEQGHHAANDAVVANENLQDTLHGRLEIERARERLADLERWTTAARRARRLSYRMRISLQA